MSGSPDFAGQSWDLVPVSEEELTFHLRLPRDAQVRSARLLVRGAPHAFSEDLLSSDAEGSKGATVTPPLEGGDGERESLVVDFHALRAVDGLTLTADWSDSDCYCRLQPWAGITWHQPEPMASYVLELTKNAETTVSFPELEVQKLMLSFHESDLPSDGGWTMNPVTLSDLRLHCRSVPSNLSLRVGDGPPVWTHAGPLAKSLETPDLAPTLNEYLASDVPAEGEQEHHVPLTIRSDTLGQVHLSLADLDTFFVLDRFADGAEERTLTFGCNQPWTQAVEMELPGGATVPDRRAVVTLSGSFADDRFVEGHGPTGEAIESYAAIVSPDHWLAQRVTLAEDVVLTGVDLCLTRLSEGATLTVEIQADVDQAPSGAALATAELSLDETSGETCWHCLPLSSPAELSAGKSYWLVLKGNEGKASWRARSQATEAASLMENVTYSPDGGGAWINYDLAPWGRSAKMVGQFRLRHLPPTYRLPIDLRVGTDAVDLSDFISQETVEGEVDLAEVLVTSGTIPLSVASSSEGELTLSDLHIEYSLAAVDDEAPPPPMAAWSAETLHGLGPIGAERLRGAGVETLAQLAELDPNLVSVDIPTVRLHELRRKAELVMGIAIDPETSARLLDRTASEVLYIRAERLSEETGQSVAVIEELKTALDTLQVALDDAALGGMTLRELAG